MEGESGREGTGLSDTLRMRRDFTGGPAAKTLHSQCRVLGVIPGQRTEHIPQLRAIMQQ